MTNRQRLDLVQKCRLQAQQELASDHEDDWDWFVDHPKMIKYHPDPDVHAEIRAYRKEAKLQRIVRKEKAERQDRRDIAEIYSRGAEQK